MLTDTIRPTKSWWRRTGRRVLAGLAGLAVLVALFAFAIEIVSHFPVASGGQLGTLAKKVLSYSVADFVPNDTKPSEERPLKGLFDRREKARKELLSADLDRETKEKHAADLAAANAEIAAWADNPKNEWMVPPGLLATWRKLRDAPASQSGPVDQRTAAEEKIAERVSEVTKRWLPADELLGRRMVLQLAAGRPNLGPIDSADANEKLAEVELEIAERTPNSPRLKLLQNPEAEADPGSPDLATDADDAHQ